MTTREQLHVNDRVRVRLHQSSGSGSVVVVRDAIVRGFSRSPDFVRVQLHGRATVRTVPIANVDVWNDEP